MMRAVIFDDPGSLRLGELPTPAPEAGEVRLKVLLAGICATDVHIFHGHFPVLPPRVLGHELAGVVEAVGPGVSPDWLGKTCGVRPARFCGACPACRRGFPELCSHFQCLGNTQDGAYAEQTIVSADQLVCLPGVSPEALVWLEPLACVLHAFDACQAYRSDTLLILGAGVLGRLMVQALHVSSSARLAVMDPNPEKVERAVQLGAETGWLVPRGGAAPHLAQKLLGWAPDGVQVVIDTTGDPQAIGRALDYAGPGGRVLLFGVSDPSAELTVRPEVIFSKELTLLAASGMTPASFDAAVDLLGSGRLDPTGLVSEVIPLEQVPAVLQDRSSFKAGKVLVRPDGERP